MSGLVKDEITKIEDSNIANYGSAEHKAAKEAKANAELEYKGAGANPGIEIWRVEGFGVKKWPVEQYGKFYRGDAYIVLRTYIPKGKTAKAYDLHFWLGSESTQDEQGTCAFKTVELDDHLGDLPVQYRECDGYESKAFLKLFTPLTIMAGGIDGAFHHVKPTEYVPRLLKFKGHKRIKVSEVKCERASLNLGDVFVLDLGLEIIQWNGTSSAPRERRKAMEILNQIKDERNGRAHSRILDGMEEDPVFWEKLGGYGEVAAADSDDAKQKASPPKLFQVSDASGTLESKLIATGAKEMKRELLDADDCFIVDVGTQIFIWVGSGSTKQEKAGAMKNAVSYLQSTGRPMHTPIQKIQSGHENSAFKAAFGAASF
jgi:gelsolin